ncbi:NAC domain-containing protein 83 [Linum perenne]
MSFIKNGVMMLPHGFRFHPTDEELVVQYLKRKVYSFPLPASIILGKTLIIKINFIKYAFNIFCLSSQQLLGVHHIHIVIHLLLQQMVFLFRVHLKYHIYDKHRKLKSMKKYNMIYVFFRK